MDETRIVIVHKPESNRVGVYINNPDADKEELLMMMSAHIAHSVRIMVLNNVQYSEIMETVRCAAEAAVNGFAERRSGSEF